MKIIRFIERHQRKEIEKILQHCGLWEEDVTRGPPRTVPRKRGGDKLRMGAKIQRSLLNAMRPVANNSSFTCQ